jgi:hypothetical protein
MDCKARTQLRPELITAGITYSWGWWAMPSELTEPSSLKAVSLRSRVRMTMRNLLNGLEETGLNLGNVVATNVYLDDINDFSGMNRIYA